jgi:hypothetical protein
MLQKMFLRAQQTTNRIRKISNELLTAILSTEDSERKHRLKLVFLFERYQYHNFDRILKKRFCED